MVITLWILNPFVAKTQLDQKKIHTLPCCSRATMAGGEFVLNWAC
jgi:hypothetical protein